jgi:ABC-type sugar transport system substrate-binding protein
VTYEDPRETETIVELDPSDLMKAVNKLREGRISRRKFIGQTAAMGLSMTAIAALIQACSSSATLVPSAAPASAAPASAAPASAAPASAATAGGNLPLVGFNQPYLAAQVTVPLYNGAEAAAKKRGYQLLKSSVQDAKLDLQLAEVNQWIALGIKGMTILPVDPNAFGPTVEKAHSAGVKSVGGYDGHIPGEDTWMGFNQPQGAGIVAGKAGLHIASNLGGKCNIAGLVAKNLPQSKLRVDDCIQLIIDHNPGAKLVATEEATMAADALKATQALLQAHPEIQMIICIADDGMIGAAQAIKLSGKKPTDIWLAGYDGAKQALQMLKDGEIMGVDAALPLLDIGAMAVDLPCNVIEGKKPNVGIADYAVVGNDDTAKIDELLSAYGA